ncbi:hypothetical protein BGZ99_006680 [Dissophora globulifera]|uniref:Uncharacterized protein n=1 Tax=Dissophora globulifera TaxID=979702 RepID=A0A9P6UZR4_9FUNG|nr:hypothetical protein BGZ99_006680 [Dissophora globulifera]
MTEYWYSFGAPRPQDLQQSNDSINISNNNKHILTNGNDSATTYLSIDMTTATAESSAVKATAVNPPRRVKFFVCDDESSDSDSDNDDFNCGNKGLEEIDRVPNCSSGHLNHRRVVGRPSPRRNAHYNLQSMEEHDDGNCEDFDDKGSIISVSFSGEEKEKGERKDYFGKNVVMTNSSSSSLSAKLSLESRQRQASAPIATTASTPMRGNGMQRRQSLLSDLLIAEKQRHTQLALDQDRNQEQERYLNSAANSDGESTIAEMAIPIPHHHHHNHSQQHHCRQYPSPAMQRNTSAAASYNNLSNNKIDLEEASSRLSSSPRLVRTKRVFKNLADLANVAPAVPVPTSIPASPAVSPAEEKLHSPFLTSITTTNTTTVHSTPAFPTFSTSPSSPASSTLSTLSTATSCTPSASPVLSTTGWTRSQVQVQIQSLVTQSTTTAQRALLTASATLTDVLFRAAR